MDIDSKTIIRKFSGAVMKLVRGSKINIAAAPPFIIGIGNVAAAIGGNTKIDDFYA